MSDLPTECQECKKPHDFAKYCSGSCSTCKKMWMCKNCCYIHECIPGKIRQLLIINNPAWRMNLRKSLDKPIEPSKYKHEVYDEIIKELKDD